MPEFLHDERSLLSLITLAAGLLILSKRVPDLELMTPESLEVLVHCAADSEGTAIPSSVKVGHGIVMDKDGP